MRKTVITSLENKYNTVLKQYKVVSELENQYEGAYGSKGEKLKERLHKAQTKLNQLEKNFTVYLVDKNITEDEWSISGLEDSTCLSLTEYKSS